LDSRLQRKRFLIPLGLAVIGGIGGFVMARMLVPGGGSREAPSEHDQKAPLSALQSGSKLKDEMGAEFQKVSMATDSESLRRLWDPIADDSSMGAFVVREMIIARWAEVDPEGSSSAS
jgi:hypothetical protein